MSDLPGWDKEPPASASLNLKLPAPDPPSTIGHPERWTRKDVEQKLIAAFKLLPNCPVYGVGNRLRTPTDGRTPMTEVLQWAALLDGDPDARKYLWTWASCKATGASLSERCREFGWKRSSVEDGRRRGAEAIAKAASVYQAGSTAAAK